MMNKKIKKKTMSNKILLLLVSFMTSYYCLIIIRLYIRRRGMGFLESLGADLFCPQNLVKPQIT